MNENQLAIAAGVLLSALFSWVPKLKEWFDAQTNNMQRLIMLVAIVSAALVIFGASCSDFIVPGVTLTTTCDRDGIKGLVQMVIFAVVANQTAYLLLPKPKE